MGGPSERPPPVKPAPPPSDPTKAVLSELRRQAVDDEIRRTQGRPAAFASGKSGGFLGLARSFEPYRAPGSKPTTGS